MKLNAASATALAQKLREVAAVLRAAGLYLCAGFVLAAADFIDDVVSAFKEGAAIVQPATEGASDV